MDFSDILKNAKEEKLNESGIRLKSGSSSVKLYHHVDMDGVFSAMLVYRQLIKQGVAPERIQLFPVQYGNQKPAFFNVSPKQMAVVVDFSRLPPGVTVDWLSDHHEQEEPKPGEEARKSKSGVRAGPKRDPKRKGEVSHKSDTERIATIHTSGIAGANTLKEISKVDSAKIDNLLDLSKLKMNKKNFPNVVNALLSAVLKGDTATGKPSAKTTGAIEYIIRNAIPSVKGVYTALKSNKVKTLISKEIELVKELKKPQEKRDDKLIKKLIGKDPKEKTELSKSTIRKAMRGEGRSKPPVSIEAMRAKNEKDIADATGPNSVFKVKGSGMWSELSGPGQPGRFVGSMLTDKNGNRYPWAMRSWANMIQIALNPDMPDNEKSKYNLIDIMKAAFTEVEKKYGNKYNKKKFDQVKEGIGGHASIATSGELYKLAGVSWKNKKKQESLEKLLMLRKKRLTNAKKKVTLLKKELTAESKLNPGKEGKLKRDEIKAKKNELDIEQEKLKNEIAFSNLSAEAKVTKLKSTKEWIEGKPAIKGTKTEEAKPAISGKRQDIIKFYRTEIFKKLDEKFTGVKVGPLKGDKEDVEKFKFNKNESKLELKNQILENVSF